MADPSVTIPDRPVLVTIPAVELCQVGTWQASTGEVTFTPEDFAAAIAAQDDPAIRDGVIKLGHGRQPGGLEQPTIGRVINLRTTHEGMTLVGDLVGVPAWLADIMPTAFGSRSIEGVFNLQTATGHTHRFVLEGVALLGVSLPAVETLEDIARLYGVAAEANPNEGVGERVTISLVPSRRVELSVSTEDISRAWYDAYDGGPMAWWWIREINVDPTEVIVQTEEGDLYRVPFTVSGTTVTFGTPTQVRVEYIDVPAAVAASESERARRSHVTVFASRAESLPEGEPMDLSTLRTSLGLPDDATDEAVLTAAAEAAAARTAAEARVAELEAAGNPAPPAPALPDGVVTIDESTLADLRVAASRGAQAHETLRQQARDGYLDRAVSAGKFAPSRRAHFAKLYDADEVGARATIDALEANTIPVALTGIDGGTEKTADDLLYAELYGAETGA